jgi:hypothetical protein
MQRERQGLDPRVAASKNQEAHVLFYIHVPSTCCISILFLLAKSNKMNTETTYTAFIGHQQLIS